MKRTTPRIPVFTLERLANLARVHKHLHNDKFVPLQSVLNYFEKPDWWVKKYCPHKGCGSKLFWTGHPFMAFWGCPKWAGGSANDFIEVLKKSAEDCEDKTTTRINPWVKVNKIRRLQGLGTTKERLKKVESL